MPMRLFTIDPLTRRRLARFRRIKRGYYSFLILATAIVLSIFAPFLAESRALMVWHNGAAYFPTFQFLDMDTFGQTPPPMGEAVAIGTLHQAGAMLLVTAAVWFAHSARRIEPIGTRLA